MGTDARRLLADVPSDRDGKGAWLKQIACDEEITVYLVRLMGLPVLALELPFRCVLHESCEATLTRGGNGEIIYHDPALTGTSYEFQTIPELAIALRTGELRRLRGFQLAAWRVRLLYEAGLVKLPAVAVPQVHPGSFAYVKTARDGFELLLRCRFFLDPGQPVSFARTFVESWCGIAKEHGRAAIYALIQQRVVRKAGEATSGHKHPTSLYLPGEGM